jgi:Holliday junction DNA helicase RuvA
MIAFVRGKIARKSPAQIIIDVNGVGYDLQISLHTFSQVGDAEQVQLLTYLHITENAQTLFGFFAQEEKDLFLQLISVSGIGASTARMMLSGMKPDEIIKAIVQNNAKQLEGIKGIGRKTAERLIVELKDKLGKNAATNMSSSMLSQNSIEQDALQALIALGINRNMAETALKKTTQNNMTNFNLEELIKQALKNL